MRNDLLKIYTSTEKAFKQYKQAVNTINVSFEDCPKVSINGPTKQDYTVKFIDKKTNKISYSTTISNNMWCKSTISYYVDWRIIVESNGQIILKEDLNLKNKKVLIIIDSKSLGDIIAYSGQVDRFQKKHDCLLEVLVLEKELCDNLNLSYKNISFIHNQPDQSKYYAVYKIGYPLENWENICPKNPKTIPLQEVATLTLGLDFKEEKPILSFVNNTKQHKKYVCIATQSTAQCKYWNNDRGWKDVISYLNNKGYDVWCIDKYAAFGNSNKTSGVMNTIPLGAIDKTGGYSLEERMAQIYNSEFFIGLGSGLSWLAWALNKKVILVSGFSKSWAEFQTPYRVINENVCNGCWNDPDLKFNKSDWMWCPRNKNFECSKEISSQMVIDKINILLSPA